ncbi:hypothetical protein [Streptomyces rubiginosohelvolus]|uniref:hypothetical protein n=1 Tax=Streptomyces rubiginosohelvolus TaxID=67362 RepID=UPI0036B39421
MTSPFRPLSITARMSPPVHALGPYAAGAELLSITDQIRAAEDGASLQRAVDHLLHPEHGALEPVREALEEAGEQVNDLDDDAYALADRFDFASEFISSAQSELVDSEAELRRVGASSTSYAAARTVRDHRGAALATSPAANQAKVSSASSSQPAPLTTTGHPPRAATPPTVTPAALFAVGHQYGARHRSTHPSKTTHPKGQTCPSTTPASARPSMRQCSTTSGSPTEARQRTPTSRCRSGTCPALAPIRTRSEA